jgi:hypothetical protein
VPALKAAIALLAAIAVFAGACGDGDDNDDETATATGTGGSATAPVALEATSLLPDLAADGFNQTAPERIPNTGQLDIAFSVYEKASGTPVMARAEVRVYPDAGVADADFEQQAEGWKNPPPGLFGADPGNVESEPLEGLDEAAAYIATNRDAQGTRLWTDIYRVGRVIVVAHVLGQSEGDVAPVRRALADGVRAKLP